MSDYEYYYKAFQGFPMPYAFVDLDKLQDNIRNILQNSLSKQIRIATKSIRSVAILRHILQSSRKFIGLMAFTAPEAVYLAEQGFDDILIGYPVWHEDAIRNIAQWIADGKVITLMVDSIDHLQHLESIALQTGVTFPVCLDIDMSSKIFGFYFGVRRSPLHSKNDAVPVLTYIANSRHLRLDGIMGYEAQIAGVGNNLPKQRVKNRVVRWMQHKSATEVALRRQEILAAARELALPPLRFVNGGGTGSLSTTCQESGVTEVTVGSGFYSPGLFDYYQQFQYKPVAAFALEIVRKPTANMVTCAGGGYIASGAVGNEKIPLPYLPEGLSLLPLEGAGEVQTPVRHHENFSPQTGDPIFFRHSKAGELCERFTHLHLVQAGEVKETVTTYRGDGRCFL